MQRIDNENMEDLISFNTPQSSPNKNFIVSSIGFRSLDDLICLNSPTCNIEIQHAKLVHDNSEDQKEGNSGYKEMRDLVFNNIMIEGVSENNVITNTRLKNPFDEITDCTSEIKIKIENHETTNFLRNNSPRGAVNILTDSLKSFQSIEGLDCGRESLGILKLDTMDHRSSDINWLNVPETFIKIPTETLITFKESTSDPLNTGFLESDLFRNNKMSVLSSISSYNSITTPSLFNSASLEASELSKIYSVNSPLSNKNLTESLKFNEAFLITNDVTRPNSKESESSKFELGDSFDDSVFIEARHLASKIADGSILETSCDELYSLDCTPPPQWNVLDDVNDCQINVKIERDDVFKVIDKMVLPPPSFNLENNDILSKTNIVKTVNNSDYNEDVNKNFLSNDENNKHNSNCSINKLFVSQNSETSRSVNHNESIENLSSIVINDKVSITSQVSNQSRSKDVKNILHNLSEIISSENRSEEQKTEGLNLLCSLSNMLCGNETNLSRSKVSSEDSGHSSIELDHEGNKAQSLENQEYFEALDLSTKTNSSHENLQVLNLSRKSTNNKRLSQSFSFPSLKMPPLPPPPLNLSQTIQKIVKNVSVVDEKSLKNDTNGSTNSRTNISNLSSKLSTGKLKPKKVEPKSTVKKGPLKAVIPVGNMSKEKVGKHLKKGSITPTTNIKYSSMFKSKRTSTPIADRKIQQPVAQSTPEDIRRNVEKNIPSSGSTQLYKRKFEYPISPLARPNSIGDVSNSSLNKSNRSESAPNVFNDNCSLINSTGSSLKPVMNRRNSASDLKVDAKKVELKRRYSISKDQSVASSLSRVRANIVKAKNSELSSKNVQADPKVPLNKNRSSLNENNSNIKPFNLMEKLKKATGKENAGH